MTQHPRLLVIDDSPTIRKLVELSFNNTDWIVEFAPSGQDGVDSALERPPDVILLDFVLPDMRGTDVCQLLAAEPRTARTPIIVMSAKHDNVRELFQAFPVVVDFIGKPFAAADIVARVGRILELGQKETPDTAAARGASAAVLSFAQKQALAQTIYAKLRHKFALIPELMTDLGGAAPAGFFARKLLTPQVMDELLDGLMPLLQGLSAKPTESEVASNAFEGQLGPVPLVDLLKLLTSTGQNGELCLTFSEYKLFVYIRSGAIVFATCNDPDRYLRGSLELEGITREVIAKAQAAQRESGKPVPISLAEARGSPSTDLGPLLDRFGRRLLLEALHAGAGKFSWRKDRREPLYVEAFAAAISIADLELAALRESTSWADVDASMVVASARFERAANFSRKVPAFRLNAAEREILAVIDGERPLDQIADRASMSPRETAEIVYRLVKVGLINAQPAKTRPDGRAPVLVSDPDQLSFVEPLRRFLQESAAPAELVEVEDSERLFERIQSESPRMVIVNASTKAAQAMHAARAVRSQAGLSQVRMVAVLDAPAPEQADQLATAGYDAVFTKPVRCSDLERLLALQMG